MFDLRALAGEVALTIRRWVHRPGLTIAVLLTLGLGIGAATAIFSVVDAVLLRPLSWPDADRLVAIYAVQPARATNPAYAATWNRGRISWPAWLGLREAGTFDDVGTWQPSRRIIGDPGDDSIQLSHVSSSLLSILGAHPQLGRLFTRTDDVSESDAVVLSYESWQRRFGGRDDVLGKSVTLSIQLGDRQVFTVVGVLNADFKFPGEQPEVYLPMGLMPPSSRKSGPMFYAIGKLSSGTSIDMAAATTIPIVRGQEPPDRLSGRLVPLIDDMTGAAARPLWLLFASAGLLLLVACVNVAGLLMGEAAVRRHEIAGRAMLGGSRARVLRELTVEHLVLGIAAGGIGMVLAIWLTPAFVAWAPARMARLDAVAVDGRVVAFGFGAGLVTTLIFGLTPALALSSTRPGALSGEGRQSTLRRSIVQRLLVGAELGLALVLVVCASLFGETLARLTSRSLGFDPTHLAVVSMTTMKMPFIVPPITAEAYEAMSPAERLARHEEHTRRMESSWIHTAGLIERVSALPGVVSAAAQGRHLPFGGSAATLAVRLETARRDEAHLVLEQVVSQGYFKTM